MGFLRISNSTPIEKTHEVYVRMVLIGCPVGWKLGSMVNGSMGYTPLVTPWSKYMAQSPQKVG